MAAGDVAERKALFRTACGACRCSPRSSARWRRARRSARAILDGLRPGAPAGGRAPSGHRGNWGAGRISTTTPTRPASSAADPPVPPPRIYFCGVCSGLSASSKNRLCSSSTFVSAFTARSIAASYSASRSRTRSAELRRRRAPVAPVVVREPRVPPDRRVRVLQALEPRLVGSRLVAGPLRVREVRAVREHHRGLDLPCVHVHRRLAQRLHARVGLGVARRLEEVDGVVPRRASWAWQKKGRKLLFPPCPFTRTIFLIPLRAISSSVSCSRSHMQPLAVGERPRLVPRLEDLAEVVRREDDRVLLPRRPQRHSRASRRSVPRGRCGPCFSTMPSGRRRWASARRR